jgi:NADPH:quinone reductase
MFIPSTFRPIAVTVMFAASVGAAPSAVPGTMKAIAMDRPGGLEVMTLRTLPVPRVDANEILIAVHSAGVAVWDLEIRQSAKYISNPKFPYVLGSDGAGVVAAVGPGVTRFKVGDQVYAYCWDNPKGGFYAEYVAVPTNCVAPLPNNATLEDAGVLGASGLTALSGVDRILRVQSGETLIIHGASGAVGTLALQMAKARGAKVLATTSGGEAGMALARRLGADVVVDGRSGDIAAAARGFAPEGADAVLALAGGDGLKRCTDALRSGGRLAYPTGIGSTPQPRPGVTITPYDAISEPQAEQMLLLNRTVEAIKEFRIPIPEKFALADAAKAQERVAAGGVLGKIALQIR